MSFKLKGWTMEYSQYRKSHRKQIRCVVCARNFSSVFDEELRTFPIYHDKHDRRGCENSDNPCEHYFYRELLRIYLYLHEVGESITMTQLINHFSWLDLVRLKKDMVQWCLSIGYLGLDSLKRISLPFAVKNSLTDFFASIDPNNNNELNEAVELLKMALLCLQGDLVDIPQKEMPIEEPVLDLGESALYQNLDTSDVELRRNRDGMVTAPITNAADVRRRMTTTRLVMERRRL